MRLLAKARSLLRNILLWRGVEADLDQEVHCHLEMLTEENVRAGMPAEEAKRAARIELGGVDQVKEQVREVRMGNWIQDLASDCHYGLRQLRKSPAFAMVAVSTLALGIGANASIFALINGLLLRPLPYPESERLVQVDRQFKDGVYYGMSFIQFRTYQRENRTFQYLAAFDMLGSGLNLDTAAEPVLIQSRRVSADFFRAIGIPPAIGRNFTAEDDRPGAPHVVILSYRVWKDFLGGNPLVIGHSVRMGGENYVVVGITPAKFIFSRETEAWVPLRTAEDPNDHSSALSVIGRLQPDLTLASAKEDLNVLNLHIRHDYPGVIEPNELGTLVTSYQERVVGDVRPALLLLGAAVACLLLIVCSNIASLLLGRAVNRRKEIAIRSALGVTRSRLFRQLLTESMLLSVAGGAAGLFVSYWCVRLFLKLSSTGIPNVPEVSIDSHVLFFTLTISLLTGLIFGTAPVMQFGRLNSTGVLRESVRATASVSTRRIQRFLVSLEICLATILLLAGSLLLSGLAKLLQVDPGFDPRNVLTLKTSFAGPSFASSGRIDAEVRKVVSRLQSLPGVQAAAASTLVPTEASLQTTLELPSLPAAERPPASTDVQWRAISPAYFNVMRIPIFQGRAFSEQDSTAATPVVIVNQAFLRKYFPRQDGMGQQVLLGRELGPQFGDKPREIVGVVSDTRELGLGEPVAPAVFIPLAQVPDDMIAFLNRLMPMNWLIRITGEPLSFAETIHRELLAVDPDLVTSNPRSLAQVLDTSLAQQRTETALLAFFSSAALFLAAIGLYGVLAYSVAQRRQEIGIRMALGAGRAQILRLVVGQGLRLTLVGILAGIAIGLALTRFLSSFLFGISGADPLAIASVVFILALVALAACLIPARRAIRVAPMIALRYE